MKLSDYKDGDAIDLLADLLEPAAHIMADPAVKAAFSSDGTKLDIVRTVLKNNKADVIQILARLDGKTPDEYECTVFTLTKSIVDLISDQEMIDFFTSLQQTEA